MTHDGSSVRLQAVAVCAVGAGNTHRVLAVHSGMGDSKLLSETIEICRVGNQVTGEVNLASA